MSAGTRSIILACGLSVAAGLPVQAQQTEIDVTLDRLVELGLRDSYRVRQMQLQVERTRSNLLAEQAGLKSRVELRVAAPELEVVSDYKWNSVLGRDELIRENTRRWQADLSIRQPVILFGYPTNGHLSLNNRVYRYNQIAETSDVRYYNRYFIEYEQPFFQPNRMRNDLEEAELDLERSELDYQNDIVGMIDDLAEDYFDLFESAAERVIAGGVVTNLQRGLEAAREVVAADSTRELELNQLQVALVNAREEEQQTAGQFRLQAENIKQRLRLSAADSLVVRPELNLEPVDVDVEHAIELARTLAPRMRRLEIQRRNNEISLEETRGRNAFRMDVGLTYGREMQDPAFENIWTEPRNSYTVNVSGYIPLWDWGQREHRVQASRYNMERTELQIEEALTEIETNVRNEVRNLEEYEARALALQENLTFAREITATTIERYRTGRASLVDMLQTSDREADTAENFLDAFLGYREALLRLQQMTHYDFERGQPLLDRFRIGPAND